MLQILSELGFLTICVGVAAAPLWAALKGPIVPYPWFFAAIWMVWILVWGGAAVAMARDYIVFDPVILRLAILFGGQVLLGVILFLTLPKLRRFVRAVPLTWLVGWQMARVVGGFFLLGAMFGQVSMPFAAIAGIGDIAVGVAAGNAVRNMRLTPGRALGYARLHMQMGLTDFAIAISTAIVTQALIGWPYVLIPLFLVPMAVLAHLAVWDRLRQVPQ